jgi:LPS-assembly protein
MTWFPVLPFRLRWAAALAAAAAASAGSAYGQAIVAKDKTDESGLPVHVKAEEISGRPERQIDLKRNVEITRGQTKVKADTACYRQVEDEVDAEGNVRLTRFGDQYTGEQLRMNLDSGKGFVIQPRYKILETNAQGKATRLDFVNQDVALISNGTYSTCEGTDPDWYLTASTLALDSGRDVGIATSTVVYFKGVPIVAAPALSFSLSGARRSGWLSPQMGAGAKGEGELALPYYFNIAPNRDLTLTPRVMLGRGIQVAADARYIGETDAGLYSGRTQWEFLPNDHETRTNRWLVNSTHAQALARGLSMGWNVRAASDDRYPSDFSKSVNSSAERQLLREVRTDYQSRYWSLAARVQNYQVLQDPAAATDPTLTVARPYDRLPQVNFHAGRYDVSGFDWAVDAEVTRFRHPDLVNGTRALLTPQVSYPVVRPGYFVTPKLMVNAASYALDPVGLGGASVQDREMSRVLPTFSLDSGMVFERSAKLTGRQVTQTLEPRLFYVYTPYKDQSAFPNFDSAEAGFNFAQIFTENRFIGSDRIADANQLTAAVVSRFIEADGAERLRLAVGQRFYLKRQRVVLDASVPHNESRSDLLLAASGRITRTWNFDSAIQYNVSSKKVYTQNYGIQWMPGEKKVINAEYRYLRDSFKNMDLSSQWPLARRWYGVARASYSLKDKKLLESLLGLEYKADCWVFRMGAQRFVTAARTTSTPFIFQLELNGLSKPPLDAFYRSIPGYSRVNEGLGRN